MVAELALSGAALGRLVRRGYEAAQSNLDQLDGEPSAYIKADPGTTLTFQEMLPMIITVAICFVVMASVRYTIGDVIATLAMIESSSNVAIMEPAADSFSGSTKSLDEKQPLPEKEDDVESGVEITVIHYKPVTAKVTGTIAHLQRTAGFFSRWRGFFESCWYHGLHTVSTNVLASIFGFSLLRNAVLFVVTSMILAPFHMSWTHAMISAPAKAPSAVARQDCSRLLLPTFVFAAAQQATFLLPLGIMSLLGLTEVDPASLQAAIQAQGCAVVVILYVLRVLAVVLTGLGVVVGILLPATIALTRIEATLLPEGRATIVPFDKDAIVGDLDLSTSAGRKALLGRAWRTVDRASRIRVVKVYLKMALIQLGIGFIGVHVVLAEAALLGSDKLALFLTGGRAQNKLATIELQPQMQAASP